MGTVFAGRYELVDPLGEGGAGVVWRVWDHRERRYLAAKVLRQVDAASLLRFMREQSYRIEHDHVVTPIGWAGEDDRVLFTMPLIRGGSVATLIGDFGALPPHWVARLLDQLLTALETIHAAGLVHRDVKPANLLLDATGEGTPRLRLSDFGVATGVDEPRLTQASVVLGTPGFVAPESWLEGADPQPSVDLYAAGMTALEMLSGQRPGEDVDLVAQLRAHETPADLAALVTDLTAADPGARPASATAARERLAGTGLLDRPLGGDVEVFDQIPPLPTGWSDKGPGHGLGKNIALAPEPTAHLGEVPAVAAPGATGSEPPTVATAMPPTAELARAGEVASGEVPSGNGPGQRSGRRLPVLSMLALVAGAILLVVAAVQILR